MNPETPQFDGQPSRINAALYALLAANDNVHTSKSLLAESDVVRAKENFDKVLSTSSVDDLVRHAGIDRINDLVMKHPDLNENHLTQLAMSPGSHISHIFSQHPKATDEHRVLHALSHPQCRHCEQERIRRRRQ